MATDDENEINPDDPKVKALVEAAVAAATEGLANKNKELLGEKKKIAETLKTFEGIDPEEFKALKERIEKDEDKEHKDKGNWSEIIEKRDAKHKKELEDLRGTLGSELEKTKSFAKNLLVDRELTESLAKANIVPQLMEAAKGLLKSGVLVKEDEDKGYRAYVDIDGDEVSISQRVKLWSESEEGKFFVKAAENNGGGAASSGGGKSGKVNPWKQETFNLTDQGRIFKENPALAAQLKREAGK